MYIVRIISGHNSAPVRHILLSFKLFYSSYGELTAMNELFVRTILIDLEVLSAGVSFYI